MFVNLMLGRLCCSVWFEVRTESFASVKLATWHCMPFPADVDFSQVTSIRIDMKIVSQPAFATDGKRTH